MATKIITKNDQPETDQSVPYLFESNGGQMIDNPFHNGDGFTPATLESHGFEIWSTGGGNTAHAQEFMLDGKKVVLTFTDGDLCHVENDSEIVFGALFDENFDECLAEWQITR